MISRPSRLRNAITRIISILVVASLLLSCNFLSIFNSSSGSELDFPTDYSAESLASQEQAMLDMMVSALVEELGPEAEPLIAEHLAGRQATLEQFLAEAQASREPAARARMTSLSAVGDRQTALIGSIFLLLLTVGLVPGRGDGSVTFDEKKTEGSTTTSINISVTTSGSKLEVNSVITIKTTKDGGSVTEKAKIRAITDMCPDANGAVPLSLEVQWDMSGGTGSKTGGRQIYATGTMDGTVNDNADLEKADLDLTLGYAQQTPGSEPGQRMTGEFAEVRVTGTVGVGDNPTNIKSLEGTRAGGQATEVTALNAVKQLSLVGIIGIFTLSFAQEKWHHGFCVELIVEGVQDSNQVEPSSNTPFTATVRHKFEGIELNVPIKPALSGDRSIDPNAKKKAPVSYRYVAGEKLEATATVNLETRSKRGVAQKAITFTTPSRNWRAVTDVYPWRGQICSLDRLFELSHSGFMPETYRFEPDDDTSGDFFMTQSIPDGSGCETKGTGRYTITINEGPETQADIRIMVSQLTLVCPRFSADTGSTELHVLLEPFQDPTCTP